MATTQHIDSFDLKKCIFERFHNLILMKFHFLSLLLFILSIQVIGQYNSTYENPLDIPIALSGTFAEIRSSHFHAGIDIKTKGRQGLPVKAVSNGRVSRIRVATSGYGKAIYIDHPDFKTSVYAHLKKFSPKIEKYIKAAQYEKESYTVQKFPRKDALLVEAGEVIGYSGNTGGSFGPHLHFEIRDSKNQHPLNPLLFDFKVEDNLRPQLQRLFLYEEGSNDVVIKTKNVSLERVNDSLYKTPLLFASGRVGVGIQMFDRQDLSYNKNGIYSMAVNVNGKPTFQYKFDEIDFNDSKYISQIIDYKNFKENRYRVQKLFRPKTAKFSFMDPALEPGFFNLEEGKSYQVLIEVSDFAGNTAYVEAYVVGQKQKTKIEASKGNNINPELDYLFEFHPNEIYIPKNTFFNPIQLEIQTHSDGIKIGPDIHPFKGAFELSFKTELKDSLKMKKSFIALKERDNLTYLPTENKNGKLTVKSKKFGDFVIASDLTPPSIKAVNFRNDQWLSGFKFLKIKIDDDFSGIKSYRGTINGKWVLFEYEPKQKLLTYDFSDLTFDTEKHELEIVVEDNVGNKTLFKALFFRK